MVDTNLFVSKAKKGDKEALIKLIVDDRDNYYRLAYSYLKNEHDAMDAVSEMTLILYDNIMSLKDTSKFYSWSKTILVNLCKKELKARSKFVNMNDLGEFKTQVNESLEDKIDIENYLSRLSQKHQDVSRLRYFLDMDYSTISQVLKIPLGTVKSRVNTSIEKLRGMIGGDQ